MLNTINSGGKTENESTASVSMPETVNFKDYMKSKNAKKTFLSKFFVIGDDYGASLYSEFINTIMNNPREYQMIREEQTWTKEGELIRMVDYIQTEIKNEPTPKKKKAKIKIDPIPEPSTETSPKYEKVIVDGSTHYKEVDIGVVSDE